MTGYVPELTESGQDRNSLELNMMWDSAGLDGMFGL